MIVNDNHNNKMKRINILESLLTEKHSCRLNQRYADRKSFRGNEIKIEVESIPTQFVQNQNYPNPSSGVIPTESGGHSDNTVTAIKYSMPPPLLKGGQRGRLLVTLKVCDILGKEVTTLVNEPKGPGNYGV